MTEPTSIEQFLSGAFRVNGGETKYMGLWYLPSSNRDEIGQAICDVMGGHAAEDAHLALTDAVGAQVIAASTNFKNADAIVDELAANAKSYIRQNWEFIKDQLGVEWEVNP